MKKLWDVVIGIVILIIAYNLLRFVLFLIKGVFQGIVTLFTSGLVYLIGFGILLYLYKNRSKKREEPLARRRKIIDMEDSYMNDGLLLHTEAPLLDKKVDERTITLREEKDKQLSIEKVCFALKEIVEDKELELDFLSFVRAQSKQEILQKLDAVYYGFARNYSYHAGFGEAGARELVGAILLMAYEPRAKSEIAKGLDCMFRKKWSPLEFSDHMDSIINNMGIRYPVWSDIYKYLKYGHSWIGEHECARPSEIVHPKVQRYAQELFR